MCPLGITVLQTSSSDLWQRGQRSDPSCCPQNAQRPAQPPLLPIKPLRAAPGGLSEWAVTGCTSCAHYTEARMVPSCREQQPWHPKSCNCLCHSCVLGQDLMPSVELLAAQGPRGPTVPQPQGICRKTGSNLSSVQTRQEVTAANESNDWINIPPFSRQMCWAQLFSDN